MLQSCITFNSHTLSVANDVARVSSGYCVFSTQQESGDTMEAIQALPNIQIVITFWYDSVKDEFAALIVLN